MRFIPGLQLTSVLITLIFLAGCGAQSTQKQSSSSQPPSSSGSSSNSSPSSPSPSSSSAPSSGSPGGQSSPSAGSPGASSPSAGTVGGSSPSASPAGSDSRASSSPGNSSPGSRGQQGGDSNPSTAEAPTAGTAGAPSEEAPAAGENQSQSDDIDLSDTVSDSASSGPQSASPGRSGGGAQSRSERIEQMESTFEGSISTYDGMILREREYIANRNNARGSEEDLEEEVEGPLFEEIGSARGEDNGEGGPGPAYDTRSSGGTGNLPPGQGNNREGDFSHAGGAAPPEDIPSGNDDDVVARQIREAAMRETDPDLREKLWEEYRRYKNEQK